MKYMRILFFTLLFLSLTASISTAEGKSFSASGQQVTTKTGIGFNDYPNVDPEEVSKEEPNNNILPQTGENLNSSLQILGFLILGSIMLWETEILLKKHLFKYE